MTSLHEILFTADEWRYASAVVSVLVLGGIWTAMVVHGSTIGRAWRRVLFAVAAQQAVLTYAAVVRAHSTPASFPDQSPDLALVAIVLSGISLWLTVIGVFAAHHPEPKRRAE